MAPIPWSSIHPQNELRFASHPSRRSTVYGTKGIVASSQPLATQAGLEILALGGNAADAAVATAAALNVTEPSCTGIGGDVFCLFFDAKSKEVKAVNGSGRSPAKLSMEYCRQRGIDGRTIPLNDLNSVTVPGAASGWCTTVEQFGSGKLTLTQILAPSVLPRCLLGLRASSACALADLSLPCHPQRDPHGRGGRPRLGAARARGAFSSATLLFALRQLTATPASRCFTSGSVPRISSRTRRRRPARCCSTGARRGRARSCSSRTWRRRSGR